MTLFQIPKNLRAATPERRTASGSKSAPREKESRKIEARAGYRRSVEPFTPLWKSASCCGAI
jgi:hypothetical protein